MLNVWSALGGGGGAAKAWVRWCLLRAATRASVRCSTHVLSGNAMQQAQKASPKLPQRQASKHQQEDPGESHSQAEVECANPVLADIVLPQVLFSFPIALLG